MQQQMVYSFLDVHATLTGPGGTVPIGKNAGVDEGGITIEAIEETDHMRIGADGSPAHSLRGTKAAKVTVRVLKTSPTNAQLQQLFSFQRASSLNWGQNTLVITNIATGDNYTCQFVAFIRQPSNTFAKDASTIDWEFNVGIMDASLGSILT